MLPTPIPPEPPMGVIPNAARTECARWLCACEPCEPYGFVACTGLEARELAGEACALGGWLDERLNDTLGTPPDPENELDELGGGSVRSE